MFPFEKDCWPLKSVQCVTPVGNLIKGFYNHIIRNRVVIDLNVCCHILTTTQTQKQINKYMLVGLLFVCHTSVITTLTSSTELKKCFKFPSNVTF